MATRESHMPTGDATSVAQHIDELRELPNPLYRAEPGDGCTKIYLTEDHLRQKKKAQRASSMCSSSSQQSSFSWRCRSDREIPSFWSSPVPYLWGSCSLAPRCGTT